MSLSLFKQASQNVPAYKNFLRKNKISPGKIKTAEDFKSLPPVSKKNYLAEYPIEKLSWGGKLNKALVYTSTSGSTGTPVYFPRQEDLHWQSSILHEFFLKNGNIDKKHPTLAIVGFGMGVWIGGLITYKAFEIAAQRGDYPLSIITPGVNKTEIINALKNLSPHYKQTILAGYPPFVKDVIDSACAQGIDFKKINLRLLCAAEAFTENFRDYLADKSHIKNIYLDTMNIYGSADIGSMAHETPLSILIRRIALKKPDLFCDIFGQITKTPTLAQYNPLFISFEEVNGEIFLTGDSVVPLIRYAIGDNGGVLTFGEISAKLNKHGIDIKKEAQKEGLGECLCEMPFVYVYERNDFSATLYGLQVYPESIKDIFIENNFSPYLTGKFTLVTKYDSNQDQFLEINIELQKSKIVSHAFEKKIYDRIIKTLCQKNSEFRELFSHIKDRQLIKLVFWPAEDAKYFRPEGKQKWVQKQTV